MTTHRRLGFAIAFALFAADQLLKYIVSGPLALESVGNIPLLPIFDFTWTENDGVALGLFKAGSESARWFLVAGTAAIAVFVTSWLWREKNRSDVAGLGLILGGALGNILDRVRFGYVVDFLDLHFGTFRPFLIFNLADAAITVGVIILLARAFLTREPKPEAETDNA
jgi:signal peptidase II